MTYAGRFHSAQENLSGGVFIAPLAIIRLDKPAEDKVMPVTGDGQLPNASRCDEALGILRDRAKRGAGNAVSWFRDDRFVATPP